MPLTSRVPKSENGETLINVSPSISIPINDNNTTISVDAGNDPIPTSATQSGAWSVNQERPSSKDGRVYKDGALSGASSNQTIYTVTSGKKLYLTSINISGINSSISAAGKLEIRDGANTIKIPMTVPTAGIGALASLIPVAVNTFAFPEPKQFSTDLRVVIGAGTMVYSVDFTGYEE